MAARYHIPIDANPKCFPLIGELAVRWGWIENQTTVLIRELLRIRRPAGDMAIGNMGIQGKLGALRSLAAHTFKSNSLGSELVSLATDIQDFDKFRNDVIHGLWVHSPRDTNDLALVVKKSLQQKIDPLPDKDVVKRLPAKVSQLREIQVEAQRLTREVKALRGNFA